MGGSRVPDPAEEAASHGALHIVAFGAHPDDDDIKAGGTAALWARRGDRVLFVSVSNGDAGHQTQAGGTLARRRRAEAEAAARVLGVEYRVLDHHDGRLEPTLALRDEIIGIIRRARADLVLLPRPWDYHPDHRAVATVVQDAAYMVTVPNVAPLTPHLQRNPVFAYVADRFSRPAPLRPDVAVDIGPVVEQKLRALHCHVSQMYEWLPYNAGNLDAVPAADAARLEWLRSQRLPEDADVADRYHALLASLYGQERAQAIHYAEAFEICELGRRPDEEELRRLFPIGV
jgi:LmbE family N-acetylglucosaminyl deacetylase